MPSPVTFDVQVGTLPAGNATKQGFAEQIAAALQIAPSPDWSSFVAGAGEPVSDVGPWLDTSVSPPQWKAWNAGTGDYQPIGVDDTVRGYTVAENAPDPTKYRLWVKLAGSPLLASGLYSSYSGAWKDVYRRHTFKAKSTVAQSIPANYSVVQVAPGTLNVEEFDLSNAFDSATGKFTAPETGVYQFSFFGQFDTDGAWTNNMTIEAWFANQTAVSLGGTATAVANPPGGRWFVTMAVPAIVSAGDVIQINTRVNDGSLGVTAPVTLTRSGTVATVTLANHGLQAGYSFTISGAGAPFDGSFAVSTVLNGNAFTYTVPDSGGASAVGGVSFPNNRVNLVNSYFTGHLIERV